MQTINCKMIAGRFRLLARTIGQIVDYLFIHSSIFTSPHFCFFFISRLSQCFGLVFWYSNNLADGFCEHKMKDYSN